MSKNSFKILEEEQIKQFESKKNNINSNIKSNLRTYRFVGDMIQHFFPKMIDTLVGMYGGSAKNKNSKDDIII